MESLRELLLAKLVRSVGSDICVSCCFPDAHRPLILQTPSWLQALQLVSILPYHILLSLHRAASLVESGVASCSLLSPSSQINLLGLIRLLISVPDPALLYQSK